MGAKHRFAILTGKLSARAIRALGAGLGSNLPGKLARRVCPSVLSSLAGQSRCGIIAVSGTNGKSTTSGLIYSILRQAGFKTVHNRQGANLVTGITATIVEAATLDGKLDADYCLFEIDEASLPVVAREVSLSAVVVTNLFRDQLDRFGELDTTARLIEKGILHNKSAAILNSDDPNVAQLGKGCKRIFYGVESLSPNYSGSVPAGVTELSYCSECGVEYDYDLVFYGQLGHYRCASCGHARPEPRICATDVELQHSTSQFNLCIDGESFAVHLPLPGMFNVYNALAASAMASWLGIAGITIVAGLKRYTTLFGRSEKLTIRGKSVLIQLIKNPAGASQVVSSVASDPKGRILIAINDNLADGRDISWLWDATFELLAEHALPIMVSGQRAQDMAVRLKYAGVPPERIIVKPELSRAFMEMVDKVQADETLWVLPTYTCLLELQKFLKSIGCSMAGT